MIATFISDFIDDHPLLTIVAVLALVIGLVALINHFDPAKDSVL